MSEIAKTHVEEHENDEGRKRDHNEKALRCAFLMFELTTPSHKVASGEDELLFQTTFRFADKRANISPSHIALHHDSTLSGFSTHLHRTFLAGNSGDLT